MINYFDSVDFIMNLGEKLYTDWSFVGMKDNQWWNIEQNHM